MTEKNPNKLYGLIGRNISYSFSETYFSKKFREEFIENSKYKNFDLQEIEEIEEVFRHTEFNGLNVTIPYKEKIIPYLDGLDPEAETVGAVNCIQIQNNKRIGFNTDIYGFENSLRPLLKPHHQNALILGDGGAAKAVKYVLGKLGIAYQTVSRKGKLKYEELNKKDFQENQILINTTPVGTFPDILMHPPIPVQFIQSQHLVYDLIYNPEMTALLQMSKKNGAVVKNGYEMLVLQAEKSWEIWNRPL